MKKKLLIIGVIAIGFIGIVLGGFLLYRSYDLKKVVTVIVMDINPNIKISLNKNDIVLKVESLNDDGKELIKSKDYIGNEIKKTISNISSILVESGYITSDKNALLLTVDGKLDDDTVKNYLTQDFKQKNIDCEVIIPVISNNADTLAKEYNISSSKASYIEEIIKANNDLTFEELKDKSINEILEISISKEEEIKKQEEIRKQEENSSNNSGTNPSSSEEVRYGGGNSNCSYNGIKNEGASQIAFSSLGLDYNTSYGQLYSQSTADKYNNICTYKVMIFYNAKKYLFHIKDADGAIVYQTSEDYAFYSYQSALTIIKQYFADNYQANENELTINVGSFAPYDDPNIDATVTYNGVTYTLLIQKKTGTVLSIK